MNKNDWRKPFNKRFFTNLAIIAGGILFYFALLNFKSIVKNLLWFLSLFMPFIVGFIIAYILNMPMRFIEKYWFAFLEKRKPRPKLRRICALCTTIILTIALLLVIILLIIPQFYDGLKGMSSRFMKAPVFITGLRDNLVEFLDGYGIDTQVVHELLDISFLLEKVQIFVTNYIPNFANNVLSFSTQIFSFFTNFILSFVIAIYFLLGKERFVRQIKRVLSAFLKAEQIERFSRLYKLCDNRFSGFISGMSIDSLIVGIISYIFFLIFGVPYPVLLAVITAVTNMIPIFGPFAGSALIVLILIFVMPGKIIGYLIFAIVLQQVDGNFIAPKIVGDSTGLPAIWVMFAIIISGGMFGFAGILIGVPAFAVLFTLFKAYIALRLERKAEAEKTTKEEPE